MGNKIELLYHHGSLIGYIEYLMRRPDLSSNLSRQYEKGEHLTIEEAVEEYMRMEDKDPYYHVKDPDVRRSYAAGIISAVRAGVIDNVIYRSDDTSVGDIICQGCYWIDKMDADPRRCFLATNKNKTAL